MTSAFAFAYKYHPDLNVGDSIAEERIKDINEAYKILSICLARTVAV